MFYLCASKAFTVLCPTQKVRTLLKLATENVSYKRGIEKYIID